MKTTTGKEAAMTTTPVPELKVGDKILFDHFGMKDREGEIKKITPNAVAVEWTSPSSGITRTVRLSTKVYAGPGATGDSELSRRNIRIR